MGCDGEAGFDVHGAWLQGDWDVYCVAVYLDG